MKRNIGSILIILFMILGSIGCAFFISSVFFGNNEVLFSITDTTRAEYKILTVIGIACVLGFIITFILFVLLRQNGSKQTKTQGKIISLITAGLAISVSFIATEILLSPSERFELDYENDPSSYLLFKEYVPTDTENYLSPWTVGISSLKQYENDEKVTLSLTVTIDSPKKISTYSITSVRIIALSEDGLPIGSYNCKIPDLKADSHNLSISYICAFPNVNELAECICEIFYEDEKGNDCYGSAACNITDEK